MARIDLPWTLEEGVAYVRRFQAGAFERGFNLSLGGGVLNKGTSLHDIDIVAAPCKGAMASPAACANLLEWLLAEADLFEIQRKRWNWCMWVVSTQDAESRQVDFFIVGDL